MSYKNDLVVLINGSFEEIDPEIADFFNIFEKSDLILCSIQHIANGKKTINYFVNKFLDCKVKAYWINRGYGNNDFDSDDFLFTSLLNEVEIYDAKSGIEGLSEEIKNFLISEGLVR